MVSPIVIAIAVVSLQAEIITAYNNDIQTPPQPNPPQPNPPEYNPPQHNPPQHNPAQHNPTQHNPPQHNPPQHNSPQNNHPQHNPPKPPRVCPCEYNYDPVCGKDGLTYMNRCILDCSSKLSELANYGPIQEGYSGECNQCICQNIDLPVCTLDGVTYPNECDLGCTVLNRIRRNESIIYLAYRKPCLGPPCDCPTIASPVCGSDNVLYRNKCVLDCAKFNSQKQGLAPIEFLNVGACQNGCLCPTQQETVCGSDGRFYQNPCYLACQNRQLSHKKIANITFADKSVCEACYCADKYEPVCGSDGNTYSSSCALGCEAKKRNDQYLTVVSYGKCRCSCSNVYTPLCGTDYKTYYNDCEMDCANSKLDKGSKQIEVLYKGECQPADCDCSYCPSTYQPMCGSDAQTYWNLCWMECNSNCSQRKRQHKIFLSKRGAC